MAVPPDKVLRLRFDDDGFFSTLSQERHLKLVSNQLVKLELKIEKLDSTAVPPAFIPVDITGWTMRWISKVDIDDLDATKKWDVAGVIADAVNGRILFTVVKASVNFEVERGYSEFVVILAGADPEQRIPLIYTLTKPVLTI